MTADGNAASLQETKAKIAELTRRVQTLSRDLRGAKDQVSAAGPGCFTTALQTHLLVTHHV